MRPSGTPKQLEKRHRRAIRLLELGKNLPTVARLVGERLIRSSTRGTLAMQNNAAERVARSIFVSVGGSEAS